MTHPRRRLRPAAAALGAALLLPVLASCGGSSGSTTTSASADPAKAAQVMRIVRTAMAQQHLKAVIVKVTIDGRQIVRRAVGESMTGVPARPDMHFRNGAVAISYVANLLLQLVDEHKLSLDDKLSKYLPGIPNADKVTLEQLARMTSGYADYVQQPAFIDAFLTDPFRSFTTRQLLSYAVTKPLLYRPGTNWSYAHTNYILLGLAIEKATGKRMVALMRDKVLGPMGLDHTTDPQSPQIPEPALHSFDSERREFLGVPKGRRFYEESSFWNPSWSITRGAIQTTNIDDLTATAQAIGTGKLLSKASYRTMTAPTLRGFGHPQANCPTCSKQSRFYTYGMGVIIKGHWLIQNPLFGGYAAVEGYLPSQRIAIGVAITYGEQAFGPDGAVTTRPDVLFTQLATALAPDDPPPAPPS